MSSSSHRRESRPLSGHRKDARTCSAAEPNPSRSGQSRLRRFLFGLGCVGLAALARPETAHAAVVEKIVAVIGDDAVLLSELKDRATPMLRVLAKQIPAGPQRTAAESQVLKEVLGRMVEEALESQAAERMKVVTTAEEIDRALENVAAQQKLTLSQLLVMARERSGVSEMDYRAEIRRQVLEGKLLSQRVRGRLRISDEDLRNAFARTVREERERREYRPSWIVLKIGKSADETLTFAAGLHAQLKDGASFAELAKAHSQDEKSREKGGDMGIHAPQKAQTAQTGKRPALSKEIEDRLLPLEPGQFTEPFRFQDAILIMSMQSRQPSKYTTFEAAKDEMAVRVQNEILAREKAAWLDELKKRTHVELRL